MQARADHSAKSKNPAASAPRLNIWWRALTRAALVVLGVTVVGVAAKSLTLVLPEQSMSILRVALSAAVVALAFVLTGRQRKQWALPAKDMARLVHRIRIGRSPIEEFNTFWPGGLHDLAAEVKLLLQDLRHHRQAVDKLEEEVQQRIANRNNVLERQIKALRSQAVKDALTGLYNRRMLDHLLPQLIAHCKAERKPMTLLMLDMDRFKALNDTLGHVAGDEILRLVGQIIRSTIREGDFGFRYGGDEFAIVLPGCEATAAKRVINRLHSLVQEMGATLKPSLRPRLSIGISTLAELAQPTGINLIKRADERLYQSKAAQRQLDAAESAAA
ncbi:MAG: GGDEF domain-containing protein [Tepidisphaeraceae bacterium]